MMPKVIAASALLAAFVTAQEPAPPHNLQELVRHHEKLIANSYNDADPNAQKKAVHRYIAALRKYLAGAAQGEERDMARFTLIGTLVASGDAAAARKTLLAFDAKQASSLSCAAAAYWAGELGMQTERNRFVAIALVKKSSFADRMDLGVQLVSVLAEPKQGEKLFADAFAAAKDDAARAEVRWHEARGTREREDLPEGSYEKALAALARAYPKTRYGAIAADRLRAMEFTIGSAPLPFKIGTLDGGVFDLDEHRGKAVLVCFWISADERSDLASATLQKLHQQFGKQGLRVLGISVDATAKTAKATVKRLQTDYTQAWARGGWESDLALRYRVEDAPHCLLLGRDGKIAGMNYLPIDRIGRDELADAVRKALAVK